MPGDFHQALIAFTEDEKIPRGYRLQRETSTPLEIRFLEAGEMAKVLVPFRQWASHTLGGSPRM